MTSLTEFKNRFAFNRELVGYIGCETERFITNTRGVIVPEAARILAHFPPGHPHAHAFGFELSACQLESRTPPAPSLAILWKYLLHNERTLRPILRDLSLKGRHLEVGPVDMPLAVYPDPEGRYTRLAASMEPQKLQAACRVAGTHFHVGMPDMETALRVHNRVRAHLSELIHLGDGSRGERMRLYRQVAPDFFPPHFDSVEHFHQYAVAHGFADNPRDCWHILRITKYGTLEGRHCGATASLNKKLAWGSHFHELCLQYM